MQQGRGAEQMEGVFRGWPNGAKAAVSLTFDDNVPSQLNHAIPILNKYGLRGTFYINPVEGGWFTQEIARWQSAHAVGHELANHTISHPCSGNFAFIKGDRALEIMTLERLAADIDAAEANMAKYIPGLRPHSFAYPCGQTDVGRGLLRRSYIPVVAERFRAARGVGESTNDPRICDLHCLSSWMVQGLSGEQLVAMLQPVLEMGHWAIFCFHGIGGDHIRTDAEPFEVLCKYLADQAQTIMTGPVQEIAGYVAEVQHGAAV